MTMSKYSTPPILTDYDEAAIDLLDQNLDLNFQETGMSTETSTKY